MTLSTPDDVYMELLEFYYETLGYNLLDKTDMLNDPELARQELREIPSWPASEQICIRLLEGFYDVLNSSYGRNIANEYRIDLQSIFERHNLRYVVTPNGKIGLSIQGLLVSLLLRLKKSVEEKRISKESLEQLEKCISKLENSDDSFRNCMTIACNLLEGTALDRTGHRFNTLKRALDNCPDVFPHNSMREAIKSLYDYLSDYPNLRHSGTDENRIRNLRMDDASLVAALAIGYASYLTSKDDGQSLLVGEF